MTLKLSPDLHLCTTACMCPNPHRNKQAVTNNNNKPGDRRANCIQDPHPYQEDNLGQPVYYPGTRFAEQAGLELTHRHVGVYAMASVGVRDTWRQSTCSFQYVGPKDWTQAL